MKIIYIFTKRICEFAYINPARINIIPGIPGIQIFLRASHTTSWKQMESQSLRFHPSDGPRDTSPRLLPTPSNQCLATDRHPHTDSLFCLVCKSHTRSDLVIFERSSLTRWHRSALSPSESHAHRASGTSKHVRLQLTLPQHFVAYESEL